MRTKKNPLYLSVAGTMGSGKTTAARLIADALHFHLVEENFGENAFLPRFYKRMNRWAFHSQTFFLMEKINQLMEIGKEGACPSKPGGRSGVILSPPAGGSKDPVRNKATHINGIVQDTPIEQDVFSYAKAQHVLGNMDDAEWRLYEKIYTTFEPHLPKPDLIIYLETSLDEVVRRIASRGREYEKKIPKSYLILLEKLNQEWMKENKNRTFLKIKTDGLNIVTSTTAQKKFIHQLCSEFENMHLVTLAC